MLSLTYQAISQQITISIFSKMNIDRSVEFSALEIDTSQTLRTGKGHIHAILLLCITKDPLSTP